MAKDKFGNFDGNYVDQDKFNDIMTNSTPEDKVKLSEVHKSINRLAAQLDKNQTYFSKEMKGISGSISATSKQQKQMLKDMKMREVSSQKDIRAVEKSVNVVLGKLGYVVDAVGRNAKKILVDTARATKQHLQEYGRALSADFAINKANFVASALAKSSPIFGYFAGKFMETSVFRHFSDLIKEKLGAAVTYVGNKLRDLWTRGSTAVKEWWKDPQKWKKLGKSVEKILKFPFKKFGQLLHYTWDGVKYLAKLPFKLIGKSMHLLVKSIGFIAKLPFKAIGAIFKSALWVIKMPFKMLGAIKEGWKDVSRKKQEKSRAKYIKIQEEFEGKIPSLQKGGYIKGEGLAHIHAAEVITPYNKLKEAFKRAIAPLTGATIIELRKLRYATVGVGRDVSAAFTASLMRLPFVKGLVSTFQTMKSAYEVYKFWFGKRNKYTNLLSRNSNPQARAADNIGILFTGMMVKMDTLIANVQLLVERFGGRPVMETSTWQKIAKWSRFDQVSKMYENMGGIRGIAKTGWETVKGVFGRGKTKYEEMGGAKGMAGAASGSLQRGKEYAQNAAIAGAIQYREMGGAKGIVDSALKQGGAVIAVVDEKTGLGIQSKYESAKSKITGTMESSGATAALNELKEYTKEKKTSLSEKVRESSLVKKIISSPLFLKVSSKLQEERGSFEVGGTNLRGRIKSLFERKKKTLEETQLSYYAKAKEYFKKKVDEVKETKSFRKKQMKLETKIKNATEGTDEKLSAGRLFVRKMMGKLGTVLLIGLGLIKNILWGAIKFPFKALWNVLEIIGGISIGKGLGKRIGKSIMNFVKNLPLMLKKTWKVLGTTIKNFPMLMAKQWKSFKTFLINLPQILSKKWATFGSFIRNIPKTFSGFGKSFKPIAAAFSGFKFKEFGQSLATLSKGFKQSSLLMKAVPAIQSIGKFLQPLIRVLTPFAKVLRLGGRALPWIAPLMTMWDAIKGGIKAREWHGVKKGEKVSMSQRITAMIGSVFGGEEVGWEGMKSGALKGAGLGMAIGLAIPVVGSGIGGAIGAVAGAVLGAVGGRNISRGLQMIWDEVKSLASATLDVIKYPFKILGALIGRFNDYVTEKFNAFSAKVTEIIGTTLDPLFKVVDPVVQAVSNVVTTAVDIFKSIAATLLSPLKLLKKFANWLGSSSTKAMDVAPDVQKKAQQEREAALKGKTQEDVEFVRGKTEKQTLEEEARKAKAKADLEVQKRKERGFVGKFFDRIRGKKVEAGPAGPSMTPTNATGFQKSMYANLLEAAKSKGIKNPEVIAQLGTIQSSLETGYGKHAPGNNYFGIKGKGGSSVSTKEFLNGQWVTVKDQFKAYDSMKESASGYIDFLQRNKRYQNVLTASNIQDAISEQGRTGYATDPGYTDKLRKINKAFEKTSGITATAAATGGFIPRGGLAYLHPGEAVLPASIVRPMLPAGMKQKDVLNQQQDSQSMLVNSLFDGFSKMSEGSQETQQAFVNAAKTLISINNSSNRSTSSGGFGSQGGGLNAQELFDVSRVIQLDL